MGSFGASGADFMLYICDKAMGIKEKMIFGMPQVLVSMCVGRRQGRGGGRGRDER